jgi:hypothetical protein
MKKLVLLALAGVGTALAYNPPIGIPNPATQFGWEIDRATPAWPAQWTAATPVDAPNCYYVDKTDPNAVDTNPDHTPNNGHPGKPRIHIPEGTLAGGTFIYVNAGTYTTSDSAGDRLDWSGVGTSANPIWITGNATTRPVIQDLCHIGLTGSTSYFVLENFEISGIPSAGLSIRPVTDGNNIDHVLIRNIKRVGTGAASDQDGVDVGNSSTTDQTPNSTLSDIVVYKCDISYCGDPSPTGSDDCGVYNAYHTIRVWVLDNLIHHVGADGIAGSHYSNYTTKTTEYYYIGRNVTYGNGENGVDLKNVHYAVISENDIMGPFTREQGWGIVLHYGASSSFHVRSAWLINNKINHVSGGIYTGLSSGADDLNLMGNIIWDVNPAYAVQADPLNGYCVQLGGSHGAFRVVNNTFHGYVGGLRAQGLSSGDALEVHGNIFSSRTDPAGYELNLVNGQEAFTTTDYNLYSGGPAFFWQNVSRTLSFLKTTGQETHGLTADAAFTDPANGNFQLLVTSPAIDASVEGPVGDSVYSAFEQTFTNLPLSRPVRTDLAGQLRPVDARWDLGALESKYLPFAPTNLQVAP